MTDCPEWYMDELVGGASRAAIEFAPKEDSMSEGNGNHVVGREPQPASQGIFDGGTIAGPGEDIPHVSGNWNPPPEITFTIGIGQVTAELTVPAGSKVRLHALPRTGAEAPDRPLSWDTRWGVPLDREAEQILHEAEGGIFNESGRFRMPKVPGGTWVPDAVSGQPTFVVRGAAQRAVELTRTLSRIVTKAAEDRVGTGEDAQTPAIWLRQNAELAEILRAGNIGLGDIDFTFKYQQPDLFPARVAWIRDLLALIHAPVPA